MKLLFKATPTGPLCNEKLDKAAQLVADPIFANSITALANLHTHS